MHLIFRPIAHVIGLSYLIIRYKTLERARQVRDEEYGGSFSACGGILVLNFIAGTGALFLAIMVIIMIIGVLYKLIVEGPSSLE